jgi:hypothetical protein
MIAWQRDENRATDNHMAILNGFVVAAPVLRRREVFC